ncbi:peptidylprolyl isomerase [Reichenbachiella faecimaris]|uniref:Peptidyl-prolyl cis-trans isomerase n=1 Tax=Reichenbachiella faecimaris TaxID=692418 RepID=A0A1W2GBW7_REIFA|nr:FKBP-type peptidyl-prolyl cis-trans isomerase [Reichenbachiella faecimaris]SMD33776.1 peptidylprolyl isomerase [Reichenbachiella faecimaris]
MKISIKILFVFCLFLMGSCLDDTTEDAVDSIEEYLERNQIEDHITTSSGLIYTVNKIGNGDFPITGQTVTVHYTGYHLDDTRFDTSYGGAAFSFTLGDQNLVQGWNEGIALFKKGGSGTLFIPWELGYGEEGFEGVIKPKEDLKFDINIVAID